MNIPVDLSGKKLGNYRLERTLGSGRMGVVYRAHDEVLLRTTAVKVLCWRIPYPGDQQPETWFLAEARAMARINHPNVVQIYGIARQHRHCYIAMEYVDGAPADAWIARRGPFSVKSATDILWQSVQALHAAHNANVVHCDIKPENLLVGADGKVKLADFGMARHLAGAVNTAPVRAGTPFYTAPEIWRGESANPSTDIYALGATYFYLLTGRRPLDGKDLQSLRAAHLEAEIPDLSKLVPRIPPACVEIVRRCLAKSPRDRYTSVQKVGQEALVLLRR